jgi:hypothetical protein
MQGNVEDWLVLADRLKALQTPRTITDYKILSSAQRDLLEEQVKDYLGEGWILFGTPYVVGGEDRHYLFQAMVKYGNNKILDKGCL